MGGGGATPYLLKVANLDDLEDTDEARHNLGLYDDNKNTILGENALQTNTTGSFNVATGANALENNTT